MSAARTIDRQDQGNELKPSDKQNDNLGYGVLNLFVAAFLIVSPCFLLLPLVSPDTRARPIENPALVLQDVVYLLILAPVLLAALFVYFNAIRSSSGGFLRRLRETNRRWALLAAAPCIGALLAPAIESKHPNFTLLLITLAAGLVSVSVYSLSKGRPILNLPSISRLLSALVILLATSATATALSYFAVKNIRRFNLSSIDLALYNNLFWNLSEGEFFRTSLARGETHLSAHCDPLLYLFVPLYSLLPGPESLVIFQAVWLCSGVIPLYLLARHITPGYLLPTTFVFAYLLHPALHGMAMFEFHSLSLVTPLILWLLWAIETERRRLFPFFLILVLFAREDMALLASGVGFFLLLHDRKPWRGLGTIAVSLGYLAIIKFFIMTDSGLFMAESASSYGYATNFPKMIPNPESGALGFILSLITNPTFALFHALEPKKLQFAAVMLLPFGLLPLLSGYRLVLCAYGAVFTLLAGVFYFYSPYFQYTATLLPFLAGIAPFGLLRLLQLLKKLFALDPNRLQRALSAFILVCAAGVSWKYGAFTDNSNFRAGVREPVHLKEAGPEQASFETLQAVLADLPQEASIAATQYLLPYTSTRRNAYTFNNWRANYYLVHQGTIHEAEKKFLNDLMEKGIIDEPSFQQDEIALYERKD